MVTLYFFVTCELQKGLIRILRLILDSSTQPNLSTSAVRRVGRRGRRRRMAREACGEESAVRGALDDGAGGASSPEVAGGRHVSDAALRSGTYVFVTCVVARFHKSYFLNEFLLCHHFH